MKITILAYGSRGDVQPYVALALALEARGHAPRLAAPENFKSFVEGFGLEFFSITGDTRQLMEMGDITAQILAGHNKGFFDSVSKVMRPIQQQMEDDMRAACMGADLVLSSPVTQFIAESAADAAGAKFAESFLAPQAPSSQFASLGLPWGSLGLGLLNRASHAAFEAAWWSLSKNSVSGARKRWGLPALHANPAPAFRRRGGLALFGFSPEVFPRPSDWPDSHVVSGAWQLPAGTAGSGSGDEQDTGFVSWLEEGSPPIYFGFGSMPVPDHLGFLEMAAELCEEMGMRALIGAGWNDIDMKACDLPDNLAIVEQADHAWLFPQCAAIVHHGGAGTTHAGLAAGVPNLVCPFFADQPLWARQVRRLGVGGSLNFQDMSYERLKRALGNILDEPVAARAAELGSRMGAEEGTRLACEALERYMT